MSRKSAAQVPAKRRNPLHSATDTRVHELRDRIGRLYLEGKTLVQVGAEVGIHFSNVSRHLAVLREEWRASALLNFSERQAQELAKFDRLEAANWQGWERSLRDRELVYEESGIGAQGAIAKSGKKSEGQAGDPRFLAGAAHCVEMRCKILGLITKKVEHTGNAELIKVVIGADPRELLK